LLTLIFAQGRANFTVHGGRAKTFGKTRHKSSTAEYTTQVRLFVGLCTKKKQQHSCVKSLKAEKVDKLVKRSS